MIGVVDLVKRRFPFFSWIKSYNANTAISDIVAGITVGLTLIPQSIAYASLAGLDPQYGLYSSICGGILYVCFGTIPELSIAPTALLSLLTYTYTHDVSFGNVNAAILLCFLSGLVELACGLLQLGFLVDFVSTPVVTAFTSAGAITIASSQIKNLFGLKFQAETFVDVWKNFFKHIVEIKEMDTILGISCCTVLLLMRKLKDYGTPPVLNAKEKDDSKNNTMLFKKIIWFASVSRNAFVVLACAVITYILEIYDKKIFSLTPDVPSGWPNVSLPKFSVTENNKTITFPMMAAELETSIILMPLIAILANVSIAKAFARGKVVDASQEMIAVGLCNIFGSFFGSYPVNASFSRAAVGSASGVKTPLAGAYTGILVVMAFSLLTPYFSYIPKATLAAVIICAVIFMVEVTITQLIWKISKIDLIPFIFTLIACLVLGIEIGILIGILVDLIKVLYMAARPAVLVEKICFSKNYIKVTPTSSILFPSAEYIREKVLKINLGLGRQVDWVLIDCSRIVYLDYTAGTCLGSLVADLKKNDKIVALLAPTERISKILKDVCHEGIQIFEEEEEFQRSLVEKYGTIGNEDNTKLTVSTQL